MADFTAVDASAGAQIAIVVLIALVLLLSGRIGSALRGPSGSALGFLSAYYILCLLSGTWSVMPFFTVYRAGEALLLTAATVAGVAMARDAVRAERLWLFVALGVVVLSMSQNVALQGIAAMGSLRAWHTNSYSAVAAIMFVYVLGEFGTSTGRRRQFLGWMGALGFAGVVLGTSSASNVSVLAGALTITVFRKRYGLAAALVFGAILGGALLWMTQGSLYDVFSWLFPNKTEAAVSSLGGRTILWEEYWEAIKSRPLLGHGFAVLTLPGGGAIRLYSHNAFVAVVLGCGALGVVMAALFLARLATQAVRGVRTGGIGVAGGAAALITGLVNSNSMPMVLDQFEEATVVFVGLISFLAHYCWRHNRGRRALTIKFVEPVAPDSR